MQLGTLLANIAGTEGNTREQWKTEFLKCAKGHREEKLLMDCYKSACQGRTFIDFKKGIPPASLIKEGFTLVDNNGLLEYHFE